MLAFVFLLLDALVFGEARLEWFGCPQNDGSAARMASAPFVPPFHDEDGFSRLAVDAIVAGGFHVVTQLGYGQRAFLDRDAFATLGGFNGIDDFGPVCMAAARQIDGDHE